MGFTIYPGNAGERGRSMTFDMETLKQVEEFAEGIMTPREICMILELDFAKHADDFQDTKHPLGIAYQKGALRLKFRLNIKNIRFAEQSSSHAMNKVLKQIEELAIQIEKDREQQD